MTFDPWQDCLTDADLAPVHDDHGPPQVDLLAPERPDDGDGQWTARGRQMVESDYVPVSQLDQMRALKCYVQWQRKLVSWQGHCEGGCTPANIVLSVGGAPICKHTRRPCMRQQLAETLELWTMSTQTQPQSEAARQSKLIPADRRQKVLQIDLLRHDTRLALAECEANGDDTLKALTLARSMQQLRQLLDQDVMADVMALADTPLGFMTDRANAKEGKEAAPYPLETVRDCVIVALLNGFSLVGNEWNIISGRFYPAQAGCKKRVEDWPGIRDIVIDCGVPVMHGDGALVPASAEWKIGSRSYRIDCSQGNPQGPTAAERMDTRIPVRVNKGMGADAILGKVKRKLYWQMLQRLTGARADDEGQAELQDAARQGGLLEAGGPQALKAAQDLHDLALLLFADLESVSACAKLLSWARQALDCLPVPAEVAAAHDKGLSQVCEDRQDQIRSTRGENSNGE